MVSSNSTSVCADSSVQDLIDNIDSPRDMLARKARSDKISKPAPSVSPRRRDQRNLEFEDAYDISNEDLDVLDKKHMKPWLPLEIAREINKSESRLPESKQDSEATRLENNLTMAHWLIEQSKNMRDGYPESPQTSAVTNPYTSEYGTGSSGLGGSEGTSFQAQGSFNYPCIGLTTGMPKYPPQFWQHQHQHQSQLYGAYQAANQGWAPYPIQTYAQPYGYGPYHEQGQPTTTLNPAAPSWTPSQHAPASSARSVKQAFDAGRPNSAQDFFAMAKEKGYGGSAVSSEKPSANVSETVHRGIKFGSQEEDGSYVSEDDMHALRFAPRDKVLDPADDSLHFGELKFEGKKPAQEPEKVQVSEKKPTEVTIQADKKKPTQSTEQSASTGANTEAPRSISLNSIFGIAGPGHDFGRKRTEPTTAPGKKNSRNANQRWADIARSRNG